MQGSYSVRCVSNVCEQNLLVTLLLINFWLYFLIARKVLISVQ